MRKLAWPAAVTVLVLVGFLLLSRDGSPGHGADRAGAGLSRAASITFPSVFTFVEAVDPSGVLTLRVDETENLTACRLEIDFDAVPRYSGGDLASISPSSQVCSTFGGRGFSVAPDGRAALVQRESRLCVVTVPELGDAPDAEHCLDEPNVEFSAIPLRLRTHWNTSSTEVVFPFGTGRTAWMDRDTGFSTVLPFGAADWIEGDQLLVVSPTESGGLVFTEVDPRVEGDGRLLATVAPAATFELASLAGEPVAFAWASRYEALSLVNLVTGATRPLLTGDALRNAFGGESAGLDLGKVLLVDESGSSAVIAVGQYGLLHYLVLDLETAGLTNVVSEFTESGLVMDAILTPGGARTLAVSYDYAIGNPVRFVGFDLSSLEETVLIEGDRVPGVLSIVGWGSTRAFLPDDWFISGGLGEVLVVRFEG